MSRVSFMKIISLICLASALTLSANAAQLNREKTMKNTFEIKSWDETPYMELKDTSKYSRATLVKEYRGNMIGTGKLEYLMAYNESGTAHFVGIEHFEGSVDGKLGTFSISHEGSFKNGTVTSSFEIIEGSQTAQLSNIEGKGSYTTGHSMVVNFDFEYKP